ncbi:MAG TPA: hypothetical protein VMT34_01330 [Aggregatilineales bacterium]|nr:hypothetical protein [Aggregatilineales bacterium]
MFKRIIVVPLILGLLTACQQASTPTATPVPPTQQAATASRPTLPPSWTPGPPPAVTQVPSATDNPVPTRQLVSVTPLPPTWTLDTRPTDIPPIILHTTASYTPLPSITPAVSPTPTEFPVPPTYEPGATYSVACTALKADPKKTDRIVPSGQDVHVVFTSVEGAQGYHLWLRYNEQADYLFDKETNETTIVIPARYFGLKGLYGWELIPLKSNTRMCPSLVGRVTIQ